MATRRKKNKKNTSEAIQKRRAESNLEKFKKQEDKFSKLLNERTMNPEMMATKVFPQKVMQAQKGDKLQKNKIRAVLRKYTIDNLKRYRETEGYARLALDYELGVRARNPNIKYGTSRRKVEIKVKPEIQRTKQKPEAEKCNSIYDDPKWIELSQRLRKERGKCQSCGSPDNLQTHHIIYEAGKAIWDYADYYLVVMCRGCHYKEHKKEFRRPRKLK